MLSPDLLCSFHCNLVNHKADNLHYWQSQSYTQYPANFSKKTDLVKHPVFLSDVYHGVQVVPAHNAHGVVGKDPIGDDGSPAIGDLGGDVLVELAGFDASCDIHNKVVRLPE